MFAVIRRLSPGGSQGSIASAALILLTIVAVFTLLTVRHVRDRQRWAGIYREEEERYKQAQKEEERWANALRRLKESNFETERRARELMMLRRRARHLPAEARL